MIKNVPTSDKRNRYTPLPFTNKVFVARDAPKSLYERPPEETKLKVIKA